VHEKQVAAVHSQRSRSEVPIESTLAAYSTAADTSSAKVTADDIWAPMETSTAAGQLVASPRAAASCKNCARGDSAALNLLPNHQVVQRILSEDQVLVAEAAIVPLGEAYYKPASHRGNAQDAHHTEDRDQDWTGAAVAAIPPWPLPVVGSELLEEKYVAATSPARALQTSELFISRSKAATEPYFLDLSWGGVHVGTAFPGIRYALSRACRWSSKV
jgi:hypothetical protein